MADSAPSMTRETVTITDSRITVSWPRCPDLSPEIEAKIRAYWIDRIERITRQVLGDFTERNGPTGKASPAPRKRPYSVVDFTGC